MKLHGNLNLLVRGMKRIIKIELSEYVIGYTIEGGSFNPKHVEAPVTAYSVHLNQQNLLVFRYVCHVLVVEKLTDSADALWIGRCLLYMKES